MTQDYYNDFDGDYEDEDGFDETFEAEYSPEYDAEEAYGEDWDDYEYEEPAPPRQAYYALPPGRPREHWSGSQPEESAAGTPGYFSGAPGPGCIAAVTVVVCLSLALFLLRLASGIPLPEAVGLEILEAAPAAEQPSDIPAGSPQVDSEAAGFPCQVSSLFPEKVLRWCGLISFYANQNGLSPDLVAALVWLESGGDELAYSRSGAVGLMQVMPSDGLAASFMCVNGPCFSDRPTTAQLQNPEFNIAWGTRFLARLVSRHGDLRQALRSYGPMDVGFTYADKVLGLFERYKTPTPVSP